MSYRNPEPIVPISDLVFRTPTGQEIYRLTQIKVRLKLEIEGVYKSGAALKAAAKEVGLKQKDGAQAVMEALVAKIDQLKSKLETPE